MTAISFQCLPHLAECRSAQSWLSIQINLGLASNTITAYARALGDYLSFVHDLGIDPAAATREHLSAYVKALTLRVVRRRDAGGGLSPGVGLANATIQQRLTAVRLFYDYFIEEGLRSDNPVGHGRFTPGRAFGGHRQKGLIPRFTKLPWIPGDDDWRLILEAARCEPLRNKLMLAVAYDAALRREELCSLRTDDIDPAGRLLRIRAETTKNRKERVVPYSVSTSALLKAYLLERRGLSTARGPLFISASHRNKCQPLSIWTWSKVVKSIAERSGVRRLTTHTLRHLCLTDLARADWDIHEIATFAGHRSTQSTLMYIHLSGRDLAAKLARGMQSIHGRRLSLTEEIWK